MMNSKMKNQKGITIVSLVSAVIILLILSAIIIYSITTNVSNQNLLRMRADVELLRDRVLIYYNRYGHVPVTGPHENYNLGSGEHTFYEIDITRLENITLNFGSRDERFEPYEEYDIYVINLTTLEVYYLLGIENEGKIYHNHTATRPVPTSE